MIRREYLLFRIRVSSRLKDLQCIDHWETRERGRGTTYLLTLYSFRRFSLLQPLLHSRCLPTGVPLSTEIQRCGGISGPRRGRVSQKRGELETTRGPRSLGSEGFLELKSGRRRIYCQVVGTSSTSLTNVTTGPSRPPT